MSATVIPIKRQQYTMTSRAGDTYPIDQDLSEIVHEGLMRVANVEESADFIAAANKLIRERHGTNIDISGPLGIVSINEYCGISISDFSGLRKALGDSFHNIIADSGYVNLKKIERIACDGDDPRSDGVRKSIKINRVVHVTWSVKSRWRDASYVIGAN